MDDRGILSALILALTAEFIDSHINCFYAALILM